MILLGELGEPVMLLLVAVPDLARRGGVAAPVCRGVEPHQQVHHPLAEKAFFPEHRYRGAACTPEELIRPEGWGWGWRWRGFKKMIFVVK